MAIKKKSFADEEIAIFDDAVIYKRGEYWQFRMWLQKEGKYARQSLRTNNRSTAIEKGKEAYLEIFANQKMGKRYFSLTTKEGVKQYIENRQKDVDSKLIVVGRLGTIKTHLEHWLEFIGRDTKLKELAVTDCEDYFYHRTKKTKGNIKQITIQNEQSSINACIKFLFRNHLTHIDKFDFKKLPRLDRNNEALRRSTFEQREFESLVSVLPVYCNKKRNKLDEGEWLTRQIIRHYILIAARSGLRVGEQRQLRWCDVEVINTIVAEDGEYFPLATIKVRASTSKVRTSRQLMCKGGHYFNRLRKLLKPKAETDLIFSLDGKTELSKRALLYHFHKIVEMTDIEDRENRDLVPYSLRHYMITERIMKGLSFKSVAEMCGTSITQIERTYYHLNDDIRMDNALA
jgi:site-specific recombinase XerD